MSLCPISSRSTKNEINRNLEILDDDRFPMDEAAMAAVRIAASVAE